MNSSIEGELHKLRGSVSYFMHNNKHESYCNKRNIHSICQVLINFIRKIKKVNHLFSLKLNHASWFLSDRSGCSKIKVSNTRNRNSKGWKTVKNVTILLCLRYSNVLNCLDALSDCAQIVVWKAWRKFPMCDQNDSTNKQSASNFHLPNFIRSCRSLSLCSATKLSTF